jgi:hypothetical protein
LKLVLGTHLTKSDLADVTAHSCHSMVIGAHIDADDVHTNPQARRLHAPGKRWTFFVFMDTRLYSRAKLRAKVTH